MKSTYIAPALIALCACTQIDTGNVGIESTLGQYKEQSLPPGVYSVLGKNVLEVSTKEIPIVLDNMTPKTKNNVALADFDLTVYYRTNPAIVSKILTRFVGDVSNDFKDGSVAVGFNYVTRQAREVAYDAASHFEMSDIHTKRGEIGDLVKNRLQETLDAEAGKGWFEVTSVQVRAIQPDPRLEEAIRDAAQVEFQVRRKEQEKALAQAEAERKKIEAQGEAQANQIIANSLTSTLVEMRRIEMMEKFSKGNTNTIVLDAKTTKPVI